METNIKTRTVTIDNEVYDKIAEVANKINLEKTNHLTNDERVTYALNSIVNTYYKNYKIDNLLF
jgi:nitric oxide synthase oxygenase domain/subunit